MTTFCASIDGHEVFLSGRVGENKKHVIQRYNRTGQLINTWQVKCGHDVFKYPLHLCLGGTPYIAMSCWKCKSISLFSMTDSKPIKVYIHREKDMAMSFAMCHGLDNTILHSEKKILF